MTRISQMFEAQTELMKGRNEYLRRCEQSEKQIDRESEYLKILREREHMEKHKIVLWWGFDGLQFNDDGTTEWISRSPESDLEKMVKSWWNLCGDYELNFYDDCIETTTLGDTRMTFISRPYYGGAARDKTGRIIRERMV